MLEFGVEVSTGELVALERVLRGLDAEAARSALAKAHRVPVVLLPKEREAVLSALRVVLQEAPSAADENWKGLALLASKLEREQETEVAEPPPQRRPRPTRK
jgi:hypothetical protein